MLILFKSECFSVGHHQDDADEALIEFFYCFIFLITMLLRADRLPFRSQSIACVLCSKNSVSRRALRLFSFAGDGRVHFTVVAWLEVLLAIGPRLFLHCWRRIPASFASYQPFWTLEIKGFQQT